jgi:tetratricopeptide (TPR) repeat protein
MKKILYLLFLSIILPTKLFANDFNTFIKKGDEYYKQFENEKALHEYEKAYNISPDNFESLMKLTRAYNDVGEDLDSKDSEKYFINAVKYAEILQEKYPKKTEAYYYLAVSYGNLALFRGGKKKVELSKKVEENIKKSIELDPKFSNSYLVLGIYYREIANLNWFLKLFAKTFFGELPEGSNKDSEKMLLKSLELNPTNIYTHNELAKTYIEISRTKEAIKYLHKIIELPLVDHQDKRIKSEAKSTLEKLTKK